MNKKAVFSWCLFDWANSAYPTVITTFVFATYFTRAIAPDEVAGTAIWGNAMAISGLAVAVLAPLIGAVADHAGARKPWLFATTLLCIMATAVLWFAVPDPGSIPLVVIAVVLGLAGFEFGMVFYNAMLPTVAPASHIGRVSGWGWALGYFGGLASLSLCLVGFVQAETPWFGVSTENAANIRAVALLVAIWFAVFCVPIFLFVPEERRSGHPIGVAMRLGLASLKATFRRLWGERHGEGGRVLRFLIARMIYADGLATLFAFGGIYAAGTFGMTFAEVIQFAIFLNVTAGIGAGLFAFVDDKLGPKPVIIVSLVAIQICGAGLLFASDKTIFWVLGGVLGIFVGPLQTASRSMMARLSPPELKTEYFGLFALSGKATSFLGPLILGWITLAFDSQRAGMATIVVFLVVGLLLLLPVKGPKPGD